MTSGGSVQPVQHIHQLRLLVNQCQSAGIFSSFEVHQFRRSTVCVYVLLHYIPFFLFFSFQVGQVVLPGRRGCQQQMLITGINVLQATDRSDMVTWLLMCLQQDYPILFVYYYFFHPVLKFHN